MEKTIFSAFWAKSTMHAAVQGLSTLDGWKESVTVMKQSFSRNKGGGYIIEMRTLETK
jgi:hypothetical protein